MDVKDKVNLLEAHYRFHRGVGNTSLLIEGSRHFSGEHFVLAHNIDTAKRICKETGGTPISLDNLDRLRGTTFPIIIDNSALQFLFHDVSNEMARLRNEVDIKESINA